MYRSVVTRQRYCSHTHGSKYEWYTSSHAGKAELCDIATKLATSLSSIPTRQICQQYAAVSRRHFSHHPILDVFSLCEGVVEVVCRLCYVTLLWELMLYFQGSTRQTSVKALYLWFDILELTLFFRWGWGGGGGFHPLGLFAPKLKIAPHPHRRGAIFCDFQFIYRA